MQVNHCRDASISRYAQYNIYIYIIEHITSCKIVKTMLEKTQKVELLVLETIFHSTNIQGSHQNFCLINLVVRSFLSGFVFPVSSFVKPTKNTTLRLSPS